MPKQIILFILLLFALALVACGPAESGSITTSVPKTELPPTSNTPATVTVSETNAGGLFPAGTEGRPLTAMGDPNAPVVFVEYSDYQCPFCRRHTLETMPQLKAKYIDTGRVYYVFKDFPIASLHPLAYRLHEAALCVGDAAGTEAYWQVNELFFTTAEAFQVNNEAEMDAAILAEMARLGLPMDEVQTCLSNGRFTPEVQQYIAEGQQLAVSGTPSFFINGNSLVGAHPYSTFQAAIEQAERGETMTIAQPPTAAPPVVPTPAVIEPRTLTALGDPQAPVTIIEYSDYQCPFCRRHVVETMPQIMTNFIDTGQVYYVFKDFPLAQLHPLAYRLHEAALCVAQQGGTDAYWQAHDLFFNEAEAFQSDTVAAMDVTILAKLSAADLPDIGECLASNENATLVQEGIAEGRQLDINGTPAFFVNGYPVDGAQPYALFEYAIGLAKEGTLEDAYRQTGPNDGKAQATATAQAAQPVVVPLDDEPSKGAANAPITIVEYSDYQCPFCVRHFRQTMPQLQQYIDSGQVRYIFKDFPLSSIHPQAQKAHEAARCARELGGDNAYWQMHDLLFVNQDNWSRIPLPNHVAALKELAAEAALPQAEFDACLDNGRYADAVFAEVAEGTQLGVNGTPAFFINGQPLVGAQPFPIFQQIIDELVPSSME